MANIVLKIARLNASLLARSIVWMHPRIRPKQEINPKINHPSKFNIRQIPKSKIPVTSV